MTGRCKCGHPERFHDRMKQSPYFSTASACSAVIRGKGHDAKLCACRGYRPDFRTKARVVAGAAWSCLVGAMAATGLVLVAWFVWMLRTGRIVIPAVALAIWSGCANEGGGVASSPCATCDRLGVENVDAKVIGLCAGLLACKQEAATGPSRGAGAVDAGAVADVAVVEVAAVVDARQLVDAVPVDARVASWDAMVSPDAGKDKQTGAVLCAGAYDGTGGERNCKLPTGVYEMRVVCALVPEMYPGVLTFPCLERVGDAGPGGGAQNTYYVLNCAQCAGVSW